MASSKSRYNAVGQAAGPRRNESVSPSPVLDGAARPSKNAQPRVGDRVPASPDQSIHNGRPGGNGEQVTSRKGTANISRPGR